jgi:hypothetical protein
VENLVKHSDAHEAAQSFREDLKEAEYGSDPWMVAMWRVRDGRIEIGKVTIHKFPKGDLIACVGHLALRLFEHMKQETTTLNTSPLPPAEGFFGGKSLVEEEDPGNNG